MTQPGESDTVPTIVEELVAMEKITGILATFPDFQVRRMLEWIVANELELPRANLDAVINE